MSLADAVGDRRPQNLPGTSDEYPNWQIPLCDAAGRPVLLEDLAARLPLRSAARLVPRAWLTPGRDSAARMLVCTRPAWRGLRGPGRQRSARATSSRPSVSSRRSAGGGPVRSM